MASYTYLVGSLISLAIWILIFLKRKDLRKEMLIMGPVVAIPSLLLEFFVWTRDWWRPPTITGTIIGIEDIILGFALGGIAAVAYQVALNKKTRKRKGKKNTIQLILLIALSIVLGITAWSLHFHSSVVWLIAILPPTLILLSLRPDLIACSSCTGLFIMLGSIPLYTFLTLIEPNYFITWWMHQNLTGISLFAIPIEDLWWFFTLGMFIGPLYKFWCNTSLRNA